MHVWFLWQTDIGLEVRKNIFRMHILQAAVTIYHTCLWCEINSKLGLCCCWTTDCQKWSEWKTWNNTRNKIQIFQCICYDMAWWWRCMLYGDVGGDPSLIRYHIIPAIHINLYNIGLKRISPFPNGHCYSDFHMQGGCHSNRSITIQCNAFSINNSMHLKQLFPISIHLRCQRIVFHYSLHTMRKT